MLVFIHEVFSLRLYGRRNLCVDEGGFLEGSWLSWSRFSLHNQVVDRRTR